MKKIISIIVFFSFFITSVGAINKLVGNYSEVTNTSNNYITMFSNYNKYIVIPSEDDSIPYKYTSSGIGVDENFNNGGLINYYEYEVAGKRNSYLSDAQEYYTMTKDGSMQYQVSDIKEKIDPINDKSGARVTEYVQEDVQITGKGTFDDPWKFVEKRDLFTLTVNPNGGIWREKKENTQIPVLIGESEQIEDATIEEVCSKFDKWTITSVDGTSTIDSSGKFTMGSSDTTIKAEYAKRLQKITLNLEGGTYNGTSTSPVEIKNVQCGNKWTLNPIPTKECSAFSSMTLSECVGCSVSGRVITMGSSDVEATINWKTKYTFTLYKDGGSGGTNSFELSICSPTLPASIVPPTRTGYTFQGYYTGYNGTGTKYFNANGTRALTTPGAGVNYAYAYWKAVNYTVKLDTRNGTVYSLTANYGKQLPSTSAHVPTKSGYTFGGYYTAKGCSGTMYVSSYGYGYTWYNTASATLYACYRTNVKVTVNNGYMSGSTPQRTFEGTNYEGGVYVYPNYGYTYVSSSGTGCSYSYGYLSISATATSCIVNFGTTLASKARQGEYVKYTASNITLWRVWRNNGSYVQLVSASSAPNKVYRYQITSSIQSYCNAMSAVARNCNSYGDAGYRSVSVSDLSCVPYFSCYSGSNNYYSCTSPDSVFWFPGTSYWLYPDNYCSGPSVSSQSAACNYIVNGSTTVTWYPPYSIRCGFYDDAYTCGPESGYCITISNHTLESTRPIIALKDTVKIVSGSGTSSSPYVISN